MAKSRRLMGEKLKIIDLIIEVVDARAPYSTKNPDFNELFKQKKRILLLNKKDLADEEITKRWIDYYKRRGYAVMDFCAMKDNPSRLIKLIESELRPVIIANKKKGLIKTLRCMAAGIPNVGKSALLNRIAGGKRLKEGNKPGVTRGLQWLKIKNNIELLDSPGLLWPKIENERNALNIALLKSINEDILDTEALAEGLVNFFKEYYTSNFCDRYGLEDIENMSANDIILEICKRRGFLLPGGLLNYERASNTIIDEFQAGKLGRISLEIPPRKNAE